MQIKEFLVYSKNFSKKNFFNVFTKVPNRHYIFDHETN